MKSIFPIFFFDSSNNLSISSTDVISAGITSDLHFFASKFISPILIPAFELVNIISPPSSFILSAAFHAIEFSFNAPNMIPFFPLSKLFILI
jgi:hypothetical protein